MVLVAMVIDLIEGENLLVVCQLRRGVIGCKKVTAAFPFVYCK